MLFKPSGGGGILYRKGDPGETMAVKTKHGDLLMMNAYPAGDRWKKKMVTMGTEAPLVF
jgi:hypothetical protein